MSPVISLRSCNSIHPDYRLSSPADLEVLDGECVAIVGPNGSGKSKLVDMILCGHPLCGGERTYDFSPRIGSCVSANIKYLEFRDLTTGAEYYQQRWNQNDLSESPFVGELLDEAARKARMEYAGIAVYDSFIVRDETPDQSREREERRAVLMREADEAVSSIRRRLGRLFPLEELLDKRIILLSSGEMRKFRIACTLLFHPRVFIIDNPFIGLDSPARRQFEGFLGELSREEGFSLVPVLSREDEIPDFVTHVIPVIDQTVRPKCSRTEFLRGSVRSPEGLDALSKEALSRMPVKPSSFDGDEVLSLRKVSIRYSDRCILKDLDLTVRRGECWAIRGANGSGKTTLLSIINGDNPQSYANDVTLFGHRRGSGESIWDIKRHIGFVSPEMHRFFLKDVSVTDTVKHGLTDALGRFREHTPEDLDRCRFFISIFGLSDLADRSFLHLSSGEQRLVLLARAFVRDPELLILDEPLHGLDCRNRSRVRDIIDVFCSRPGKSLLMVTHYDDELPSCVTRSLTLERP